MAAEHARFAMPLARLGLVVPFTLAEKLVEIVGPAMTRQILFTGRPLTARRAYEIGMVHEVVPVAEIERVSGELARARRSRDAREGVRAMLEKRKPDFRGG